VKLVTVFVLSLFVFPLFTSENIRPQVSGDKRSILTPRMRKTYRTGIARPRPPCSSFPTSPIFHK
jgi:hypothetical protein